MDINEYVQRGKVTDMSKSSASRCELTQVVKRLPSMKRVMTVGGL